MKRFASLVVSAVIAVTVLIGCAMGPRYVWNSAPETRTVSNDIFDAQLSPVCTSSGCVSFVLTIKNKSDKNIELNWNKTLFISGGQTSGGFMFEGVVYKDRNNPKSPDMIFAKGNLVKTIYPNNMVDFSGGKYGTGWYNAPMGSGENGVYLATLVDGKEINEKLTVNISATEIRK